MQVALAPRLRSIGGIDEYQLDWASIRPESWPPLCLLGVTCRFAERAHTSGSRDHGITGSRDNAGDAHFEPLLRLATRRAVNHLDGPVRRDEVWANDVAVLGRALMGDVVREMRPIPKHDVLAENALAVHPLADLGIGVGAPGRVDAVVDLI